MRKHLWNTASLESRSQIISKGRHLQCIAHNCGVGGIRSADVGHVNSRIFWNPPVVGFDSLDPDCEAIWLARVRSTGAETNAATCAQPLHIKFSRCTRPIKLVPSRAALQRFFMPALLQRKIAADLLHNQERPC